MDKRHREGIVMKTKLSFSLPILLSLLVALACNDGNDTSSMTEMSTADASHQTDGQIGDATVDAIVNGPDADLTTAQPNWSLQRRLSSQMAAGANIQPALTFDTNQNLWLVYAFLSETSNQILLQKYDINGNASGPAIPLVEDAVGIHNEPAICALSTGGVVAVWSVDTRISEGSNLEVRFRIISDDGIRLMKQLQSWQRQWKAIIGWARSVAA